VQYLAEPQPAILLLEREVPADLGGEIWEKTFQTLFQKAHIPDAHVHRFRDTFAVKLLEKPSGRSPSTRASNVTTAA
jgi:hypothetical protein